MPSIAEIKQQYPALSGLDDEQVVDAVHQAFYQDFPREEIASSLGVKVAPPPAPERNAFAVANDTVIELANAAAGGVKSAAEFVVPGNPMSRFIQEKIIRPGEESQSDVARQSRQQFQQEIADSDGIADELGAVGRKIVRDPLLTAAQAAGSFVVPGVAVKGAAGLAGIAGAGAVGATRAGLAGGAAAGAMLSGGDAAGQAYELVINAGGTPEQATEAARNASVIPAAVGALGGVVGAERLFAGAKGFAGGVMSRALKTGGVESLQEGFEEGVTQYEGQRAAVPYDPNIDPSKGVAAAAGMGAAMGGMTGAGVSILNGEDAPPPPAIKPPPGPMTRATDKAPATEPVSPPAPLPQPAPEQAQALLAHANERARLIEEKANGTKDQKITGPDGKPMVAPGRRPEFLTPDEKEELALLKEHGGDAAVLAGLYPEVVPAAPAAPPVPPVPPAPEDVAQQAAEPEPAPVAPMEAAADPLTAEISAYASDMGEVSPQMVAAKFGVTVERAQQILAEMGRDADTPSVDELFPAPDAAQPDDILNPKGEPFKTLMAARNAAKTTPGAVVEVPGGYAIRPQERTLDQAQNTAQPAQESATESGAAPAVRSAGVPGVDEPGAVGALSPEWKTFDASTGTLNIPRAEMPQIKAEHRGAMVNFLSARGVTSEQAEVDPSTLKPTQAEFSPAKVDKATKFTGADRSILVSADGHVVDGHHQWLAKMATGQPVKVIQLNAPIAQLLPLVREFPSSTVDEATASVQDAPQSSGNPRQVAQAAPQAAQAQAPAGSDAAAAGAVAAAGDAGAVEADGLKRQKAIERVNAGTAYFGTKEKADAFVKNGAIGDTHEVVMAKPGRFEIRAKVAPQEQQATPVVDQKPADADDKAKPETAIDRRNRLIAEREAAAASPKSPTSQPTKKPKPANPNAAERAQQLADYFKPGNVLRSYSGFDEVLEFKPQADGGFTVRVHEVRKIDGEWVRDGKPQDARTHSSLPEPRVLAAGPVDRLGFVPAGSVKYSAPRVDGQPFPNAVDRGVAPASVSQPKTEKKPEQYKPSKEASSAWNDALERYALRTYHETPKASERVAFGIGYMRAFDGAGMDPSLTGGELFQMVEGYQFRERTASDAVKTEKKPQASADAAPESTEQTAKVEADAPERVEYPTPLAGQPEKITQGQRAVVDFMNKDMTREQLRQRFTELALSQGDMRSITNRIDWTQADADVVLAAQAAVPAPAQAPAKPDPLNEKEKAAKEKMKAAAAKLADLLGKNTRLNITPEQEQKLLPIVIELFDGAMELGYVKFKQAARYVRDFIAQAIDQDAADSIPIDTLQGAYIATSRRHKDKDITPKGEVVAIESVADLEETAEQADTAPEATTNDSTTPGNSPALDSPMGSGLQPEGSTRPLRGARKPRAGSGRGDDADLFGSGGRLDGAPDEEGLMGDRGGSAGIQPGANGAVAVGRERLPSANYRPQPGGLTREGSWLETAKRNIDLIDLAIAIDKEGRKATPEEQARLSKYVGFGAGEIRNKIFPVPPDYAKSQDPRRLVWSNYVNEPSWKALAERIEALPREWQKSVLQSSQYAHYTSEGIIRSVWSGIERLGFTGGNVFEPGMGIGSFAMLMPESVAATSKYTGVEFDGPTALIARLLSPDENMLHGDFIKRKFPKDFFDVNVGNPPFSQTKILGDPAYEKFGFMLHDFFFAKGIDSVRPGGLQVFVTSKGTMDKQNDKARKYLSDRADLLGAIRLPSTAFEGNAGTSVVTDVIFLRKRLPGEAPAGQPWNGLATVDTKDGPVMVNEYYAANPSMVLGEQRISGNVDDMGRRINSNGRGGEKYTVVSYDTTPGELDARFAKAIEALPENAYSVLSQSPESIKRETAKVDFDPTIKHDGAVYLSKDGTLMRVSQGAGRPLENEVKLSPKDKAWFTDYVQLRDLVQLARQAQSTDGDWQAALKKLNKAYDQFRAKNGPITDFRVQVRKSTDEDGNVAETESRIYKNKRLYREDYDQAVLTSIEKINESGEIVKAPFLLGRTIGKPVTREVKSIGDALAVSLDNTGIFDIDDVAKRMKLTRDEAVSALDNQVYQDLDGKWLLADEYLSGNVVDKLEQAEEAARLNPAFERNVEALKKVQPEKLGPSQISAKLGASWIPAAHVNEFAKEIGAGAVTFDSKTETWQVDGANLRTGRMAGAEYGTAKRSPSELLESALNSRSVKITMTIDKKTVTDEEGTLAANEAMKKIKAKFKGWIWTDTERAAELVEGYNKRFNNLAPRVFDGSHLTLPGVSLRFKLHPHQLRAILRQVQTGDTYLAHAVGAGKTIEMIAGGMEQKRLGLIKKPMYVVPNHMLEQFSNEFMELYPLANIMVADDENFSAERRKAFIASATLNAPDAIVITHDAYQRIGVKEESVEPIRDEIISDLEIELSQTAKGNDTRVRRSQLEQQIEAVGQRFDRIIASGGKDATIKFEDMGVDFVYVDEAHAFRKLDFHTGQQIKGIDPTGSKRALDMYVKTRILQKQRPGRAMVFATGTPVTNTMGELYTIMRFFAPKMLDEAGISSFDAWARQFAEVAPALEQNAAGKYELVERFAKFDNVPELMSRVRSFMDVLTSEHLGSLVKRPDLIGGKPNLNVVQGTPALKAYMEGELAQRIEISKKWKPSPQEKGNPDPIVSIITDGRFAALDPRFFGKQLQPGETSILTEMAAKVVAGYKAYADTVYLDKSGKPEKIKGGTQIVFYNLGFGEAAKRNRGFDSRAAFTKSLTDGGIPRAEIAWFDDADTDAKKEAIFKDMRSGKLKVLIGSAKKMGTGVNVQVRLRALHYQDPPWYPSDVEQPHGRIIRQGNQNPEVAIEWYTTKGTYQSTMWQMVGRKQRFIDQAFMGDKSMRSMDDLGEASLFEQAAAVASGDPRALQLAGLKQDVERLERLQAAHASEQVNVLSALRNAEWYVKSATSEIKTLTHAFKSIGEKFFSFTSGTVGDATFTKPGEFGQAIKEAFNRTAADSIMSPTNGDAIKLGDMGQGIEITMEQMFDKKDKPTGEFGLSVEFGGTRTPILYSAGLGADVDAVGLSNRFRNAVNGVETELRRQREILKSNEADTIRLSKKLGAPFEHQQEMLEKYGELKALEEALRLEGLASSAQQKPQVGKILTTKAPDESSNLKQTGAPEANTADVVFSSVRTGSSAKSNLSQDAVVQAVASALNRVPGGPNIRVVANPGETGLSVPASIIPKGVTLPDGSVFVFSDYAESSVDVFGTVFHELFHRGSKVRFTSNLDYITKMLDIAAKDAVVQAEVVAWKNTADGMEKRAEFEERGPMTGARLANFEALAIEEALATMGERVAAGELRNPETTIKHIWRFLSKVVNAWGMNRLALWLNSRSMAEAERFILDTISMSGGKVNQFTNSIMLRSAEAPNDPRQFAGAAREAVHDLFNHPGKLGMWHKSVGTQYNLAQRSPAFKKVYDRVQEFLGDVSFHATDAADLAPSILPKLDTWRDIFRSPLTPEDNKAIAAPIFEGTLAWRRDEAGKPVRMSDVEAAAGDLTIDQKSQRLLRGEHVTERMLKMWRGLPVDQYEKIIEGKFEREMLGAGIVWTDAELKEIFSLSPKQIELYHEFRNATDKSLASLAISDMLRFGGKDTAELTEKAMAAEDANVAAVMLRDHLFELADQDDDRRAVLIDTANKMIEKADKVQGLMDRGYAPLSRFGHYSLDVVDAEGERVYFGLFESKAEANKMARAMRINFPGAEISQGTMSEEAYKLFAGVSPETLELFGGMLGLESEGSSAKDQVFQEYLKLAKGNRSAMKRLIQRKGIAGFSEDAGRVLAGFIYSNARQTASSLHMGAMAEAASAIPNQQGELKDAALKLVDYIKNPVEEAAKFRGLLFAQYLGGSIASAMVNMLQPIQVTIPYLSQFGGARGAALEMKRALGDVLKKTTGDKDLDEALKTAEEQGIVAPQEVHQLMAQAQGQGSLKSGDGTVMGNARAKAGNAVSKVSLAWGKAFGAAEQFNRRLTFIASYRLAKKQGLGNPVAFAEKTIAETQFVYNKGNKGRWARGAVGGTIFTFKQYSISYLELLSRMATAGEPGSPERAAGRKAALMAVGVLLLMGGAGGLPFMEDAEDLIDGFMQRVLGYNFSTKQKRKELLAEVFGEEGSRFLESGVSGLPGAPIDVSGRLGLGNLIPGTGLFVKKDNYSRDIVDAVGPAGDMIRRGFTAAGQLLGGDVGKAVETISPVAARNLIKAVDMANMGMYRDQDGKKILDADGYEALAKGIGFQPNAVARYQEAAFTGQRMISLNKMTESEIADRWAIGIFEQDQGKVQAARAALQEWNRKNPESPIRINMAQIVKRVRAMRMPKAERIAKTAPKEIRAAVRRELMAEDR